MRPIDPRLLRRAGAARGFLALTVLLGLVQTALVVAFCLLVSAAVVTAVRGVGVLPGPWVVDEVVVDRVLPGGELLDHAAPLLLGLVAVVAARAGLAWATEAVAARAATKVKSQLRRAAARALVRTDDVAVSEAHAVTVLGSGLDALDAYFSRYLPQLVLTVLAVPLLLVVLALADPTTAVIVALTMPLVPIFMVLIGWATQAAQQRQWRRLDRLGAAYLDVVEGLSTLKIFNRQHRQRQNLRRLTEQHRAATMKVLRVSFLSGFVLELAASLSVALVAVSIGVRLIDGELGLFVGLFVLMVVPEAYAPLRQVGAQFHAAADGAAAAEDVFDLLDSAESQDADAADHADHADHADADAERDADVAADRMRGPADLRIEGLGVRRAGDVVVESLDLMAPAGRLTVLTGPSGAGKSTVFAALLGLLRHTGTVQLGSAPLTRDDVAWTGQRHGLRRGTLTENITLGEPAPADPEAVRRALADVGLEELDPELPLGVRGAGLSGGQAHRVAVARALHRARSRGCPLLLLDEPSAALDAASEAHLIRTLQAEARDGRTVVVISHRSAVVRAADHLVRVHPPTTGPHDAADLPQEVLR